MESIHTDQAPKPIGPYSQAVKQDGWVFISGQIPLDPATGRMVEGDIRRQTRQALDNLKLVLEKAGGRLGEVVKTTIYVADLKHFAEINAVYQDIFSPPYPARAVIQAAALPAGAAVEIEAIAKVT